MSIKHHIIYLGLFCLFFFSCREDSMRVRTIVETAEPILIDGFEQEEKMVTATILGQIVDEQNNPLTQVLIKTDYDQTQTDENGFFILSDSKADEIGTLVTASKSGYVDGSIVIYPKEGSTNRIKISLLETTDRGSFLASDGAQINLPGGTKINFSETQFATLDGQLYEDEVFVFAQFIDPSEAQSINKMPGSFRGIKPSELNQVVSIISHGVLQVDLFSDMGEKLQIVDGYSAEIEIPIPDLMQENAPEEIPLWYFNEHYGLWVEEKTATRSGNNYIAEVDHFSFWSSGTAHESIQLSAQLNYSDGSPVADQAFFLNGNNANFANIYSDENGQVNVQIPSFVAIDIQHLDQCNVQILDTDLGMFNEDMDIVVSVDNSTFNESKVVGRLFCDGVETEDAALAEITIDGATSFQWISSPFEINLGSCNYEDENYEIKFHDLTTGNTTGAISLRNGAHLELGKVNICQPEADEFLKCRLEHASIEYFFPQPSVNSMDFLDPGYTRIAGLIPNVNCEINFQGLAEGDYSGEMTHNGRTFFRNHMYFEQNGFGYDGFLNVAVITRYGEVDEYIEGFFSGTLTSRNDAHEDISLNINGSFRVKVRQSNQDISYAEFISEGYRYIEPDVSGSFDASNNVFETNILSGNPDNIILKIFGNSAGDYSDPSGMGTLHDLYNNMEEINWEINENTLEEFIVTGFPDEDGHLRGFWSGDVRRINLDENERFEAYGSFVIKIVP